MNIELPAVPAGIVVLLGFFAPYAIAALNGALAFVKKTWQKKAVTVIVAVLLAVIVIVFYQNITGEPVGNLWVFALLSLGIVSLSYALVTKQTAAAVERNIEAGVTLRRDLKGD
ncbi:MAG: hypothetical protein P0Y60_14425 [Candidatus Microbacterium colombiense]|nr:MAG: hypothetical protein P0Y60_14425 [Microbacterium sp.]